MTALITYSPCDKTLIHNGNTYPFYIGFNSDVRLHIALEVLAFTSGNKTLQEVVENINELKQTEEK